MSSVNPANPRDVTSPSYICSDCAEHKGGKWPDGHVATCHQAMCGYCNQEKSLAHVTDWRWPDWNTDHLREA